MAERGKGLLKSGWHGLVDFAIAHAQGIAALVVGAAMTYLAAITKWLTAYGPVAWGAIGIASFLIVGLGWWVIAGVQRFVAMTRFAKKREETVETNPLDDHFSRRRINLSDFFHPYYKSTRLAKFQDCELFGPAVITVMGNSTFSVGEFNGCEAVIIKPQVMVIGVIAFENCTFERCKFFRVTFLMSKEQYLGMMKQVGGTPMPVISDGTAGPL